MRLAKTLLEVGLKQTYYYTDVYVDNAYYSSHLTNDEYYTYFNSSYFTEYITTYPNDPDHPTGPPGNIGGWAGGWYVYTSRLTTASTNRLTQGNAYYTSEYVDNSYYSSRLTWKYTTW